ncbi:S-layer homology domain-containing protein [Paenibacillus puerhi]|uniref:S-layer homology domain-containing protein n=1 Tax=Paenibacillus puerhi TaxID=2692622 RepID=UPI00135927EB|nr:S-layer homology domain-containing protein [Paenibacillus puerhi]
MVKRVATILSFALALSCLTPLVHAEEPATKGAETQVQEQGLPAASTSPSSDAAGESTAKPAKTGRSSDDFADLKDLSEEEKAAIDELLKQGIFEGISADTFGIDEKVNRAQFAKIAALIFSLEVDNTLKQSSFEDVSADDPAHSYALPYVEALKKAGLTTGYDAEGKLYHPSGEVTRQELAVFLIRGLGLEEEAGQAEPGDDETVSVWAEGHVALALEKKLMTAEAGGLFEGSLPATRKTLALAAYEVLQYAKAVEKEKNKPDKVSIIEVKAIKSNKLLIKLDREVDTTAELVIIKKGLKDTTTTDSQSTTTTEIKPLAAFVQWTDASLTEATMELDLKLEQGKYIIELKGLPESDVEKGTFEFEAEEEKISHIEFVPTSDKLPQSKVMIPYKAINQYDEETSLKASNVNISIGARNRTPIMVPNSRFLILDLSEEVRDSQVFVSLFDHKNFQQASHIFTVGDKPIVSKVEVGDLKFQDGQSVLKTGFRAFLNFKAYDQYGNRVVDTGVLNSGMGVQVFMTPGDVINYDKTINNFQDIDNDGYPELQLDTYPNLKIDKEVTVHLFAPGGGDEVSKTLKVAAPKAPASVEFYAWDKTLADGDAEKFVEIIVKDATGYKLTVSEIVYAELQGQLAISSTGPLVLESDAPSRTNSSGQLVNGLKVQSKGSSQGKIRIKEINGRGPASVMVRLVELNMMETLPLEIKEKRTANAINSGTQKDENDVEVVKPLHYSLLWGTEAGPTFKVVDQYGDEFRQEKTNFKVDLKLEKTSGQTGSITQTKINNVVVNDVYGTRLELKDFSSREIKYTASANLVGSYQLTASLVEVNPVDQSIVRTLGSLISTVEAVNPATAYVKYELDLPDSLFATGRALYDRNMISSVTDATYVLKHYTEFGKKVEVRAKNALGTEYKRTIPIIGITSNATRVIGHDNKEKVVGLDSGKATVTAFFEAYNGDIQSVSKDVSVNSDELYVKESKMNDSDVVKTNGATLNLNGLSLWDKELIGNNRANFQIRDQYGHTIDFNIPIYNGLMDVKMFVGNVKYIEPYTDPAHKERDTISVSPDFKLVYTRKGDPSRNNIKEFTLYLASTHGIKKKRFILYP